MEINSVEISDSASANLRFRESFMDIRVEKGLPPQFDFLIAAKLIHLVSNVVFEALDILSIRQSMQLRQIIVPNALHGMLKNLYLCTVSN